MTLINKPAPAPEAVLELGSWGGAGACLLGAGWGLGSSDVIVGSNTGGGAELGCVAGPGCGALAVVTAIIGGMSSSATDFPCRVFFNKSCIVCQSKKYWKLGLIQKKYTQMK